MTKKKEPQLLVNRIQTPDGTILISKFTHDYVSHVDANGEEYFIDGGMDYTRTSVNKEPSKLLCLYDTDMKYWFEEIRKYVYRGTFDENGNRIWKPICELSNNHLKNIIEYNKEHGHSGSKQEKVIKKEIKYRKEHGIVIEDNWKGQEEDEINRI